MHLKSIVGAFALMLTTASAFAAGPQMVDVKLNDGVLRGVVVNQAGQPTAQKTVALLHGNQVVAKVATDKNGRFEAKGLRPGLHFAAIDGQRGQGIRLWASEVAPPNASAGVLLVNDKVVRGNCACPAGNCTCGGGGGAAFGLPEAIVTGAAIGGVIAIASASGS